MSKLADEEIVLTESQQVFYRRFAEAREYGFTHLEARLYAESTVDSGELRRLRLKGCKPAVAANILLP